MHLKYVNIVILIPEKNCLYIILVGTVAKSQVKA